MLKRAIVHLFWGERHLHEALRAASTSMPLNLPRVAITDEETARLFPDGHPFEQVIVGQFRDRSLLAKTELYRHLPADYDSFLFLDVDTVVVADVSFAFAKAEQHGLAAAMAPHYSLGAFWGFDRVLHERGHESVDQLQYNSGVLFFRRCPEVAAVMNLWEELAYSCVRTSEFDNDQPYLTLAMEMLGFNPYTLSPSYNYRALGELASGTIRIWHSHAQLPTALNRSGAAAWPPRRFIGSTQVAYRPLSPRRPAHRPF